MYLPAFSVLFVHVVVHVDMVRLRLWTAAINRSIVHPPDDIWVWRATVEWYWQEKTEELRENPVPVSLCPSQIQNGLTGSLTRVSKMRGLRPTAVPWLPPAVKEWKVKIYKTIILPAVLCGCETWSVTLKDEHRLRVLRTEFWEEYLDQTVMEWQENGGDCNVSSFIICTHPQISLGKSSQGEWGGRDMWHAWERREKCTRFGGKDRRKEATRKTES
jgi:hypothetical protein